MCASAIDVKGTRTRCVQESMVQKKRKQPVLKQAGNSHRSIEIRFKSEGKRIWQVGKGEDGTEVEKLAPIGRWKGFRPKHALPGCNCDACERLRVALSEGKRFN